jgi:hypothetical protein
MFNNNGLQDSPFRSLDLHSQINQYTDMIDIYAETKIDDGSISIYLFLSVSNIFLLRKFQRNNIFHQ